MDPKDIVTYKGTQKLHRTLFKVSFRDDSTRDYKVEFLGLLILRIVVRSRKVPRTKQLHFYS